MWGPWKGPRDARQSGEVLMHRGHGVRRLPSSISLRPLPYLGSHCPELLRAAPIPTGCFSGCFPPLAYASNLTPTSVSQIWPTP